MSIDLLLAKIILAIQSGDPIAIGNLEMFLQLFQSVDAQIDLCNTIAIAHRKRYLSCISDEQRSTELSAMLSDYKSAFTDVGLDFIDPNLFMNIFMFVVSDDYRSTSFRESCVSLIQSLNLCKNNYIRQLMTSRLLSIIIRCALYGSEPFDSIISECVSWLDANQGNLIQVRTVFFGVM